MLDASVEYVKFPIAIIKTSDNKVFTVYKKIKFFIKDFCNKCDQILRFLRI